MGGNPLNRTDPLGLWEVKITGGEFAALQLTFGYNSGQWNVGLHGGLGEGFSAEIDPNEKEEHPCGMDWGIAASGQFGFVDGLDADAEISNTYKTSEGSLSVNDPFINHQSWSWGVENGEPQPTGDPSWTFGESIFIGAGGTYYSH